MFLSTLDIVPSPSTWNPRPSMEYNPWFKTIDLAQRPSEIWEDRDVERRYPPKIEPAACNDALNQPKAKIINLKCGCCKQMF